MKKHTATGVKGLLVSTALLALSAGSRFFGLPKKREVNFIDNSAIGVEEAKGKALFVNNGGQNALTPEMEKSINDKAVELYKAKMKRDEEIDAIVLNVRKRDKKDFTNLANTFKKEDKTPAEFAMALTTSDEFSAVGAVEGEITGSGIEVIGVRGMAVGTPGEVFVASEAYKAYADKIKRGSSAKAAGAVMVENKAWLHQAVAQALGIPQPQNATTSSGLTSIEKLPGVVTLGVRPLMVKDLIAPGATNNTTIRYIQEVSFTNAATTVGEGSTKPQANFSLAEQDSPVRKIAVYTKVTDELFADYLSIASYINMRLPYMVERTEEDQILNGDGTGQNLLGIISTPNVQTLAKGADTRADALYKALTRVRWGASVTGGFEPDGYVIHPTDWESVRLSKDNQGQYFGGGPFTGAYGGGPLVQFEMLWGKPVAVTPAIAQGTALTGSFRLAAQYFQRQGLTMESTNTDQDDFIKNMTTIRAESRLALAVYRPQAFCMVTGL